jgi:hypothetical protein
MSGRIEISLTEPDITLTVEGNGGDEKSVMAEVVDIIAAFDPNRPAKLLAAQALRLGYKDTADMLAHVQFKNGKVIYFPPGSFDEEKP